MALYGASTIQQKLGLTCEQEVPGRLVYVTCRARCCSDVGPDASLAVAPADSQAFPCVCTRGNFLIIITLIIIIVGMTLNTSSTVTTAKSQAFLCVCTKGEFSVFNFLYN